MIVYKVVYKNRRGRYLSALHTRLTPWLTVEYKIGELAKAPIGGLFVFKCLKCAIGFSAADGSNVVLRCETDRRVMKTERVSHISNFPKNSKKWIKRFWTTSDISRTTRAPNETYRVKSLTPIKEIKL